MKKRIVALLAATALGLSCAACSGLIPGTAQSDTTQTITTAHTWDEDNIFSNRDYKTEEHDPAAQIELADNATKTDSASVSIEGNIVTITQEGTYRVTGTMTDGQIVVNVSKDAKVQLILDNASITCTSSAAIYLKQADKLFITTAADSQNTLCSLGEFVQTDDNNVDGTIFAKDDITFNGEGTLNITSESGHGIVGKDDVRFTSGTYVINAAKKGISGKDSVCIADGSFTVTSGADAIQAKNDDDTEKGYLYISGGTFVLDGGKHGVRSSGSMLIRGGEFTITSVKDAVHSDADLQISDGDFVIDAGDDGIHADNAMLISGGTILINRCYEGIEAEQLNISGGNIKLTASDDGLNAAGSSTTSGGMGGMFSFGADANATINISGGEIEIIAGGDGVDSNGTLVVSGGTLYVSGPTDSSNGALDYETNGTITGGIVIAAGAVGMAQNFGSDSTQGAILWSASSTLAAGTTVTLTDENGMVLCSYTPQKAYQCVVISAPDLAVGGSYTITAGEQSETITLDSLIYGSSGMMMGGGFGGGKGGGFGGGMGGGFGKDGFTNGANSESGTTDGEAPSMPDGETPTMPDGTEFTLPDGMEMPTVSEDGTITMPDGTEFTLPDGAEMPTMPSGEAPTLPDGETPTTMDGIMPTMPNGETPTTLDGDTSAMQNRNGKGGKGEQGNGKMDSQNGKGTTALPDNSETSST